MEHEEIELKIFPTEKFGPIRLRVCAEYQTDLVSVLSRRGMSDSPCGDRTVNDGEVTATMKAMLTVKVVAGCW